MHDVPFVADAFIVHDKEKKENKRRKNIFI